MRWTDEEKYILEDLYVDGTREEIMGALPDRSWTALRQKANSLGLRRKSKPWSKEDKKTLQKMYPSEPQGEILSSLNANRSWSAVKKKAQYMEIERTDPPEWRGETSSIDMTGGKFGRLKVLEDSGERTSNGLIKWKCECECGNITYVNGSCLRRGQTKSCGCLLKDKASQSKLPKGESTFNVLYYRYKQRADSDDMEFNLSKSYVRKLFKGSCYYCGEEPSQVADFLKLKGTFTYNGIDRIDSDGGYVKENVVSCCKTCNRMKMELPKEKFFSKIKSIFEHRKLQGDGDNR